MIGSHKEEDNFTFVNSNGCCVIDNFIGNAELFDIIKVMFVDEEISSDHLPIVLKLNTFLIESNEMETLKSNKSDERFKGNFSVENIELYKHNLSKAIENNDVFAMCFNTDEHIDSIIKKFQDILIDCSRHLLSKVNTNGIKRKSTWFDKECKDYKTRVNKALQLFWVNNNVNNLEHYLSAKKNYHILCRKKT